MLAHQTAGGEAMWKPLKENIPRLSKLWLSTVGNFISGRHLAISGDLLVATLGWGPVGSRDATVGAEQPSVTENGAAQTVPTIFKCSS